MNGRALYNEHDPFAASWLEQLIAARVICPGVVDRRDIRDLKPSDLDGFNQFHAFAGIGGWSYALRLAGIPDDAALWTGSCPCQPFSAAGRGLGFADERHLWPAFFHLIDKCRPPIVFGEQVASPAGLAWLDLVHADLEGADYAVGAADLCAAGVGAPHIRQRLWWVAHADEGQRGRFTDRQERFGDGASAGWQQGDGKSECRGDARAVAYADAIGQQQHSQRYGAAVGERQDGSCGPNIGGRGGLRGLANANEQRHNWSGSRGARRDELANGGDAWGDLEWLHCRDGKARPTKPGLQPLAHGASARVGRLRGYGNAVVPQVAAEFVRAAL